MPDCPLSARYRHRLYIDTNGIGCVASSVVLYPFLIFIIGVVAIPFVMAAMVAWFFSWKPGTFPKETYEQQRSAEIEIYTEVSNLTAAFRN